MTNVLLEKKGNIAVATINRPKALNALNSAVVADLDEMIGQIMADEEIRALVITGSGEKAFVAIALYFAILNVHPTPFCIMDEIAAALDAVKVVRTARYTRPPADKTQFIVITHRRGTMEAANRLYGVTMKEKGISRILAIDVSEIEKHI